MQYLRAYDSLIQIDNIKLLRRRTRNGLKNTGIFTLGDLEDYLVSHDLSDITGVDATGMKEIEIFLQQYRNGEYEIEIILTDLPEKISEKEKMRIADKIERHLLLTDEEKLQVVIPYVNPEIKNQKIMSLSGIGFDNRLAYCLYRKGYSTIGDLEGLTKEELFRDNSYQAIRKLEMIADLLEKGAKELLAYALELRIDLKDYQVILLRARGFQTAEIVQILNLNSKSSVSVSNMCPLTKIYPYIRSVVSLMNEDDKEQIINNLHHLYENEDFNDIIVYWYTHDMAKIDGHFY